MKTARLFSILLAVVITCVTTAAPAKERLRELHYPDQIQHKLTAAEKLADKKSTLPNVLIFKLSPNVRSRKDGIFIDVIVINPTGRDIDITAQGMPLAYGGATPLTLKLSSKSSQNIRCHSKPRPPGPPPPLSITIPANTRVIFTQHFGLSGCGYRGSPEVELVWHFWMWNGESPSGKFKARLFERKDA